MKVLVTGSSGLIGSYLVKRLSRECNVIGLDLKPSVYTTVVYDVRDYGLVERAMRGVDVVIHCAAQTSVARSVEDPLFDAESNIVGTLNLLEIARRSKGLKRFVYVSSAAVYGPPQYVPIDEEHPKRPISPYGISKLTGELYAKVYHELYDVPSVCIRPFNVYGKNQNPKSSYSGVISRFVERIEKGLPLIVYGDGEQTRDFIHVGDVVNMIILAIKCEGAVGEVFNCGTGREVSINELAKIMMSISGKALEIKHSEDRPGDIRRSCADISKAEKVLGFRASISIEQGLKEVFNSG